MAINHSSHRHRLVLKPAQGPYTCYGCKEQGLADHCYQCIYKNCNFYMHEECALPSPSAFHPFFPRCSLKFYEKAPAIRGRVCDACGKDVLGYSYQCTHRNAHDLHPCCLKLKHKKEASDEGVTLSLSNKVSSRCLHCNSKEIAKGVKGWSYTSSPGNYCYHVACVKEIVYENWKKGKFSGTSSEKISLSVPNRGTVSRRNGSWSRNSYWKMAKTVLKLIISAIFGDPFGLIAAFVEGFTG